MKGLTPHTLYVQMGTTRPVFDNVSVATSFCREVFCRKAVHVRCDAVRCAPQSEGICYSARSPDLQNRFALCKIWFQCAEQVS